ncbi:hypothetical protein IJE86_07185 [bacterium]|nr:hypothetical protein [bacterium]
MDNLIVTKRIEPYDLIEGIKKNYIVEDFTFTGYNKFDILESFLNKMQELSKNVIAFGLYMKNVNKFYLISSTIEPIHLEENINTIVLNNILGLSQSDLVNKNGIEYTDDREKALSAIDMGKAEASFIFF